MTQETEAAMVESIFPVIPETVVPVDERIAAGLLREIEAECQRRIGQHCDWWRAFWQSPEASPQEICDKMNGSAGLFFGIASVNKNHILAVCQMLGKTPEELGVDPVCLMTPQNVTINSDGTATIG
jgi:hypothetical protein